MRHSYIFYNKNRKMAFCMYLQSKNRLTDIENKFVVAKGEGGGGHKDLEFGISRCSIKYRMDKQLVPTGIAQETIVNILQ